MTYGLASGRGATDGSREYREEFRFSNLVFAVADTDLRRVLPTGCSHGRAHVPQGRGYRVCHDYQELPIVDLPRHRDQNGIL